MLEFSFLPSMAMTRLVNLWSLGGSFMVPKMAVTSSIPIF